MLEAIFELFAEWALDLVCYFYGTELMQLFLGLVWWLAFFPVVWILASPVILLLAPFRPEPYREAVGRMLGSICPRWKAWGESLMNWELFGS